MTPCACSMSSLRVHRALPCCPYFQLRSIKGVDLPERLSGASETSGLALKSTSQFCSVDCKADLSRKFSRSSVEASSRVRRSNGGILRGYVKPKKPISQVRYRVQDAVDSPEVVENGTDESRTRSKERNRKKRNGERRRRVQILSNNGMVDLEEHLGLISSDDEAIGGESYRDDDVAGMAAAISADEEGRRILESTLLRNDVPEIHRRQETVPSTPYEANFSFSPGQASGSERSELYEGRSDVTPSQNFRQDVIEVEVEGKKIGDGDLNVKDSLDMSPGPMAELPGGKRVVELVAAWDGLAGRLPPEFSRSRGSDLLLRALKLTVTVLKHTATDGIPRPPLSRALAVAHILVDLGMDAEVISTGLLREVADVGLVNYAVVEDNLSGSIARLLRDCSRVRHIPSRVETLDDASAKALRQFCLAFHDIRAVVVELAFQLDTMRHIHSMPRYQQQIVALETMQLYAPLAHAMGIGSMALELEDLGFRVLFPDSYSRIGSWLRSHWIDGSAVVEELKEQLSSRLKLDLELQNLVTTVNVVGRYKSRFSTMRKLLKDGRKPEEVYDVLGLRVILEPKADKNGAKQRELGIRACYRALEIATSQWQEVPGRLKDYIENRKDNGYESLHVAVNVGDRNDGRPLMEIQIRTSEMDDAAMSGEASHSLYKGGMTDPEQVKNLKLIMVAAANAAASRFREVAGNAMGFEGRDHEYGDEDQIFNMFDKNRDGVISIDEFREVLTELGADEGDALELMQIVDVNTDGSVSAEEFEKFRHQIQLHQNFEGADRKFSSQLGSKLQSGNGPGVEVLSPSSGDSNASGLISNTVEGRLESSKIAETSTEDASGPSPSTSSPEIIHSEGGGNSWGPTDVNNSVAEEDADGSGSKSEGPIPLLTDKPKLISVPPDPATGDTSGSISPGNPLTSPDVVEEVSNPYSVVKALLLEDEKVASGGYDDSTEATIEIRVSDVRRKVAEGSLELARDLAIQVSREYPSSTKVLLHLASIERKCGNLEAARALYARTIEILEFKADLGLEYVKTLQAWAFLEAQGGNPDRAKNLFSTCVTASEELQGENDSSLRDAGVYGMHGWAMLEERRGNWTIARDLLERAADLQPGNAVIHQSRASLEARVHNISAARIHFTRAVKAAPEDVKCWHAWAKFEAGRGNMEKARKLFKQALEVDSKNLHSLQAWAHHERRIGTAEARAQARKLYQTCVDIDPKNVYCWQSWGILEEESENFEGARMLFKRGLTVNIGSVPCLQAYAHMERKCKHLEAARVLLQRALVIEPNNAAVLMELALVEEMSGNNDAALDYYKRAASVDKKKSAVKRRMFETRKTDLQASGSRSKAKAAPAGRNRRRTSPTRKSASSDLSLSDDFSTEDLEQRYERIQSFVATGHRDR